MRRILASCWATYRRSWTVFHAYYLLFQAIALLALVPAGQWVLAHLVATSGRVAVGNEEIAGFILSPLGIATMIVAGTLVLALDFAQLAGFIWIAARDVHGEEAGIATSLRRTFAKSFPLLKLGLLQVCAYFLAAVPFVAAGGGLFLLVTRDTDLNFLVTERPPVFWVGAVVGAVLALGGVVVYLFLRAMWVHSVPICLLEGLRPLEAMRASRRRARGSTVRIALVFLAWWAVVEALSAIGLALLHQLGGVLVGAVVGNLNAVLLTVGALVLVNFLLVVGLAAFGWGGHSLLTVELYRAERGLSPGGEIRSSAGSKLRLVFAAGILVALVVGVGTIVSALVPVDREIGVTAHRGSSREAPENTVAAIRRAVELGADYAEIDVQEIADGTIVVFHDTDFVRVSGSRKKIWEVDAEEVRGFDVGSWFSPEFAGERVPTLEEAIGAARGRIKLNLELKPHKHGNSLVASVVAIVGKLDFDEECILTSLSYEAVAEAKKLNPALRCGFIVAEHVGDPTELPVDLLAVRTAKVTKRLVSRARSRGIEVHAWTVNDAKTMARLADIGVDNIMTDDPALARRVLGERMAMSPQERILLALRHWWWR